MQYQIQNVNDGNSSNGKEEYLRIGKEGKCSVSEMRDIPIPRQGCRIKRISYDQGKKAAAQNHRKKKELNRVCI